MEDNEIDDHLVNICNCKYINEKCSEKECLRVYLCPFGLFAVVKKGSKQDGSVTEVRALRYIDKVDC